jgi:hypothetical protein
MLNVVSAESCVATGLQKSLWESRTISLRTRAESELDDVRGRPTRRAIEEVEESVDLAHEI